MILQSTLDRRSAARRLKELRKSVFSKAKYDFDTYLALNAAIKFIVTEECRKKQMNLNKTTMNNIELLISNAIKRYEEVSTAVYPPLPCGADDHWCERQDRLIEEVREDLLNLLDWKHEQIRRKKPASNTHAFDERYFAYDDNNRY